MTQQRSHEQPARPPIASKWWEAFFDQRYAAVGLSVDEPERIDAATSFLIDHLHLQPGEVVFDQCCGVGRLSIPLARRGLRVIGVDLIDTYITQAAQRAGDDDNPDVARRCEFHCHDAFEFTCPQPCDAAFNWFTSIGYSDDDAVNIRMIQRAFESLKSGGRFAVDYHSGPKVLRQFWPRYYNTVETADGVISVLMEHHLDLLRGVIEADWTFIMPDGQRDVRRVLTRLYMPHELAGMAERVGFHKIELFGSTDGEPFTLNSTRCIMVAEKP